MFLDGKLSNILQSAKSYKVLLVAAFLATSTQNVFSADFQDSYKKCLADAGGVTPENMQACRKSQQEQNFETITFVSTPKLPTHEYNLSLGLGEPVFTGLKRKRDDFIDKYINQPIAEIEEVRDRNIQTFNLKTIYGETGNKIDNAVLNALESAFGLDALDSTFNSLIEKRREKCNTQYNAKMSSCNAQQDPYKKSMCVAEASDIQNNCFKYTTKSSALDGVRNKLNEWEDKILDEIAAVTLVNQKEVQNLYKLARENTQKADDIINTINEDSVLNFNKTLDKYLSAVDPVTMMESKVGMSLGIGDALVGPGAYTKTNQEDLINFTWNKSRRINNLCDLTTCLVYPDSKKYQPGTKNYSAEYQQKCANKGLTEEELNRHVNELRRKLMTIVGKLVLDKLIKETAIHEYMQQIKRSAMCGAHATMATLQSTASNVIDSTCASCNSLVSSLSSGASAISKSEEKTAECLASSFEQSSTEFSLLGEGGLGKLSGWITGGLTSAGLWTASTNIGYATPTVKLQGQGDNTATGPIKNIAALQACQKEGEAETWVANYEKCVSDDLAFDFNFEFNFKLPELMKALRDSTRLQCESSLNPVPITTTFTFDALYNNPDVTPASYSNDNMRWIKLTRSLISANETLKRMKINPALFLDTEESHCAYKALDLIENQKYAAVDASCAILDIPNAPVIDWTKTNLDNFGEEANDGSLPTTLVPSVHKLCQDSATTVSDHFANMAPFSTTQLQSISKDPNSFYNVNNSVLKPNRPENAEYRITRSIANLHFCSEFFTNIASKRIFREQDLNKYHNAGGYLARLALKRGELSARDYQAKKDEHRQYQETLKMLNRRTEKERFNLCVRNSTYRDVDYQQRVGINKAIHDFCKTYKIERFDKYFQDALTDFDFPIVESNKEAIKRIEKTKRIRMLEYQGEDL